MPTFLVTGVSRGIGRAVAERLGADGHQVYGVARTARSVNDLTLAGLAELDLSRAADFGAALAPLLGSLERLDGLVHCAGIVRPGPLAQATPADFTDQFAVNVVAAVELTRLWLPGC